MHEGRCDDKLNSEIIMIFSISSRHKETSHSVQLKRNYTFVSALGGQLFLTRTLSSWTTWMKCSSTMTTTDVMYLRVYCISTPPHHVRSDSPLWGVVHSVIWPRRTFQSIFFLLTIISVSPCPKLCDDGQDNVHLLTSASSAVPLFISTIIFFLCIQWATFNLRATY